MQIAFAKNSAGGESNGMIDFCLVERKPCVVFAWSIQRSLFIYWLAFFDYLNDNTY